MEKLDASELETANNIFSGTSKLHRYLRQIESDSEHTVRRSKQLDIVGTLLQLSECMVRGEAGLTDIEKGCQAILQMKTCLQRLAEAEGIPEVLKTKAKVLIDAAKEHVKMVGESVASTSASLVEKEAKALGKLLGLKEPFNNDITMDSIKKLVWWKDAKSDCQWKDLAKAATASIMAEPFPKKLQTAKKACEQARYGNCS